MKQNETVNWYLRNIFAKYIIDTKEHFTENRYSQVDQSAINRVIKAIPLEHQYWESKFW